MDKKLFASSSVLGLKNPAKPFPVNQDAGVLRWRYQTNDEANIPLSSKYQDQLEFCWFFLLPVRLRARLHQASASTLQQLCHDASVTALIENDGVAQKWVATQFWRDFIVFNENQYWYHHCRVVAALTLTLGVNGPLVRIWKVFEQNQSYLRHVLRTT